MKANMKTKSHVHTSTAYSRVVRALRRGERVTRKNALLRGWCENLTATISDLREMGYDIETIRVKGKNGNYTRYKLNCDLTF